jgi:histidine decarboxylase
VVVRDWAFQKDRGICRLTALVELTMLPDMPASVMVKEHPMSAASLAPSDQERLDELFARFQVEANHFVGYPCSADFDYSALDRFLAFPLNNVGDPYLASNFHLNTHDLERDVLAEFAALTHAPADLVWGYVTGGGTEGNMYGIYLARELYPEGIVYHSEDTHYSVNKILRCLHVRNIMIRSRPDGTMDLDDFEATIKIHRDVPPIVFANVGTTMKGAVDDLAAIHYILKRNAIHDFYIHADAALSGMILPFLDTPPAWDFAAPVDSISISGHKMIGCPFPCGIALARKPNVDRIARRVEYIGSLDTTISGSRNALAPLFLWYAFKTVGLDGFRRRVRECFAVADYALERLNAVGRHAWRHPYSNTVVFDRPPDSLVSRWQLAVKNEIAHAIAMPHVTRQHIDRLMSEIQRVAEENGP